MVMRLTRRAILEEHCCQVIRNICLCVVCPIDFTTLHT